MRSLPAKYKFVLGMGALLAVAAYFLLIRGGEDAGPGAGPGIGFGGPQGPVAVNIASVEKRTFSVRANFVGTLEGIAFAELYPKASGQIVGIFANTGDVVRAGQVLAQIDPAEPAQRVRQAEASLRMAEATLGQRESAVTTARLAANRTETLFNQRLVSEQEQEDRQATLLSNEAQYRVAEAQVEQAQAALSSARLELENTRVRAPFNGVIGRRFMDAGNLANNTRPIFTIVDISTIRTTVQLVERDVTFIRAGQPATVSVPTLPGQVFEGQVARISPIFNRDTGTAEAEVEIANPGLVLSPGMLVNVSIGYRGDADAILVPRASLIESEDDTYVFLVEQSDSTTYRAKQVAVRVLGTDERLERNLVAIDGLVEEGDQVITLGHETLRDGASIRPAGALGATATSGLPGRTLRPDA
jgi:membrane fusion protein, multidrug efflux system